MISNLRSLLIFVILCLHILDCLSVTKTVCVDMSLSDFLPFSSFFFLRDRHILTFTDAWAVNDSWSISDSHYFHSFYHPKRDQTLTAIEKIRFCTVDDRRWSCTGGNLSATGPTDFWTIIMLHIMALSWGFKPGDRNLKSSSPCARCR